MRLPTVSCQPIGVCAPGLLLSALAAVVLPTAGRGQMQTDVFLAELKQRDGRLAVGGAYNLTRRAGYDNQPFFTPDGESILFTAIHEDGQADIYRYDLGKKRVTRLTVTEIESEYSPTVIPGGDAFSVVRVEADSAQRLWRFDSDSSNPRLLLPDVRPVGYHAWVDEHTVALFVLGRPPTLQLGDLRTGKVETVVSNIGRSLHKVPGKNAVSFLHHLNGEAWIKEIDVATRTIRPLIRRVEGNEFYAWAPDGVLLMGAGSKLYAWRRGGEWEEIADLSAQHVTGISRLAVSPDGRWLAIVAEDVAAEP